MMKDEHDWQDYAASYALDALDDDDRAAFEEHLAGCARCRDELAAYREAAASIALAAPQRTPPAALRARILDDVKIVRPLPHRPAQAPPVLDVAQAVPVNGRVRPTSRAPWLLAAASLVLALGALALYAAARGRIATLEDGLANAQQQVGERDARIAALDAVVAERDALIGAALDPRTETATLVAEGAPPAVRLYRNTQRGRLVIAAANLPPAPSGRTYQLWGLGTGAPVSLGTFDTSADGTAVIALPLDPAQQFAASAITEEPAGGSPAPTTQPFLLGSWTP